MKRRKPFRKRKLFRKTSICVSISGNYAEKAFRIQNDATNVKTIITASKRQLLNFK